MIKSLLDNDLYKFTTSYAYMKMFPHAIGTFTFVDRNREVYTQEFLESLKLEIYSMSDRAYLCNEAFDWAFQIMWKNGQEYMEMMVGN